MRFDDLNSQNSLKCWNCHNEEQGKFKFEFYEEGKSYYKCLCCGKINHK